MRDKSDYWNDETRKEALSDAKRSSYHHIALSLNFYQLANVLRAIRMAPNDGDWKGEVLMQINHLLNAFEINLAECNEGTPVENESPFPYNFSYPPNTPYPNGFKTDWSKIVELDQLGDIKQ